MLLTELRVTGSPGIGGDRGSRAQKVLFVFVPDRDQSFPRNKVCPVKDAAVLGGDQPPAKDNCCVQRKLLANCADKPTRMGQAQSYDASLE